MVSAELHAWGGRGPILVRDGHQQGYYLGASAVFTAALAIFPSRRAPN